MKTNIIASKDIAKAAELIKAGEVVAFPTETVYGLGANALDETAVQKIFKAKGRPSDNPLIIHIYDISQLSFLAQIPPDKKTIINQLVQRFWPGPLTIILPKKSVVSYALTGGLETVAIRMPANKIAQTIIAQAGVPIAAPSANLSGKPSGTRFEHVRDDFDGRIAGMVVSSPSKVGLESTVLDLTTPVPVVLRPGGVSVEALEKIIPDIVVGQKNTSGNIKSPGMKYTHYAPLAKIILFEPQAIQKIPCFEKKLATNSQRVRVIYPERIPSFSKELFALFRECDQQGIDYILLAGVQETGIGLALMNRMRKAAYKIVS